MRLVRVAAPLCLSLSFLFASPHGALVQAEDNWPQYRGAKGDGVATAKDLPLTWSESENIAWKTPVTGKAWSSPVVWGKQVWVSNATPDGKKLSAVCLDLDSGKVIHDVVVFDIEKPQFCIERNSYASSTPVIEEGRIYLHYGSHGTACLDTKTGKPIWTRQDLPCNHHRGAASSPIMYDNLLVLTYDGFDLQYVVALDKQTGATVWKADRNITYKSDNGDIKKAYATPALIQVNGQTQLVNPSAEDHIAYNPKTGEEIWRVKCGGMNVASVPLYGQGLVFLTTGDGGKFKMFALDPTGKGDVTNKNVAWNQAKGVPKYSSLVLVDDLLYASTDQGILTSFDAKTGEVVWQERVGGSFTASPLSAAGRVYFFAEDGSTTVTATGRDYKVLATNKLADGFMASPAVTGDSLILRTKTHVYRVTKR